jgi:hypothetical protein
LAQVFDTWTHHLRGQAFSGPLALCPLSKTSKHIVHLQQQKNRFLVVYHRKAIEALWQSQYSTARLEGFTSIFQAARAGARGYRNPKTFVAMIYRIRSPVDNIIKST